MHVKKRQPHQAHIVLRHAQYLGNKPSFVDLVELAVLRYLGCAGGAASMKSRHQWVCRGRLLRAG
ncbi:hypothetical protein D3C72_2404160 [compost metagenome]